MGHAGLRGRAGPGVRPGAAPERANRRQPGGEPGGNAAHTPAARRRQPGRDRHHRGRRRGGAGASTIAMALAQGLGLRDGGTTPHGVALVDGARRAELSMYHDVGDVIQGLPSWPRPTATAPAARRRSAACCSPSTTATTTCCSACAAAATRAAWQGPWPCVPGSTAWPHLPVCRGRPRPDVDREATTALDVGTATPWPSPWSTGPTHWSSSPAPTRRACMPWCASSTSSPRRACRSGACCPWSTGHHDRQSPAAGPPPRWPGSPSGAGATPRRSPPPVFVAEQRRPRRRAPRRTGVARHPGPAAVAGAGAPARRGGGPRGPARATPAPVLVGQLGTHLRTDHPHSVRRVDGDGHDSEVA